MYVCIIASKKTAQLRLKTEKKITRICRCNQIAEAFFFWLLPFQLDFFHIYTYFLMFSASLDVVHVYPVLTCLPAVWVVGGCWEDVRASDVKGGKSHIALWSFLDFFPSLVFFSSLPFHPAVSGDERCKVRMEGARWWWHPTTNKKGPVACGAAAFLVDCLLPCLRLQHSKHTLAKSATAGGEAASLSPALSNQVEEGALREH